MPRSDENKSSQNEARPKRIRFPLAFEMRGVRLFHNFGNPQRTQLLSMHQKEKKLLAKIHSRGTFGRADFKHHSKSFFAFGLDKKDDCGIRQRKRGKCPSRNDFRSKSPDTNFGTRGNFG